MTDYLWTPALERAFVEGLADPAHSASVTDVRDFLGDREDVWRENEQMPREDRVEVKAVVRPVPDTTIQCEVAQSSAVCEGASSLRGVQRRGNPQANASQSGLPRFARNDGGDKAEPEIAAHTLDAEPFNPALMPHAVSIARP